MSDEELMERAIGLARRTMRAGHGGPFAALVVRAGEVVAEGWNRVTSSNDPTAHAEVVAIRRACAALGSFRLAGCEIVTTCEPCPMCLAAIYWARLERICYAATRTEAAAAGFDDAYLYEQVARPAGGRAIPERTIAGGSAGALFAEWLALPGTVPY